MTTKPILVTGATGKQGGAVVDQILASPDANQYTILGVTRNANSPSAQKLASKSPLIKIVQGDYADLPALFQSATAATSQPVWGVFSVQTPEKPQLEEQQGKNLIDEAKKRGVSHFVYASVERGGDERSWSNPTPVPHFISKHNIEQHLKANAGSMTWTILRPVAFMENLTPGFGTKVFMAALRDTLGQKPLQFISTEDIGYFAAQSFLSPQKYNGQAIGLAGDEINYEQIQAAFNKTKGYKVEGTYGFIGSLLLAAMGDMGKMLRWFKSDGFGVDIQALRKQYPPLMSFETWLEKRSKYEKKP